MVLKKQLRGGYTLIELLVVISIIGVLMAVGTYSYSVIAAHSRDNKRKSDLSQIQNALQLHYIDLRSYPTFDNSHGGAPIYSAAWQLSSNTTCTHATNDPLSSKYITSIPDDPQQQNDLTKQGCSALNTAQSHRYLYITQSDGNGPTSNPTLFGLLATLERPTSADVLAGPNNPLLGNTTSFGPWYTSFDNYGKDIGVDANYMITGQSGR